jgi:hypothetical protein
LHSSLSLEIGCVDSSVKYLWFSFNAGLILPVATGIQVYSELRYHPVGPTQELFQNAGIALTGDEGFKDRSGAQALGLASAAHSGSGMLLFPAASSFHRHNSHLNSALVASCSSQLPASIGRVSPCRCGNPQSHPLPLQVPSWLPQICDNEILGTEINHTAGLPASRLYTTTPNPTLCGIIPPFPIHGHGRTSVWSTSLPGQPNDVPFPSARGRLQKETHPFFSSNPRTIFSLIANGGPSVSSPVSAPGLRG